MRTNNQVETFRSSLMKENWQLPSAREKYISRNPKLIISKMHESDNFIAPLWTKISKTPWNDRAQLCGGYGVRMENTNISLDAPECMKKTESFINFKKRSATLEIKSDASTLHSNSVNSNVPEATYVLPGGESMLNAVNNADKRLYQSQKMFYNKQVQ